MRPLRPPVPPADRVVLDFGPTENRYAWAVFAVASLLWLGIGLVGVLSGAPWMGVFLLLGGLCGVVAVVLVRAERLRTVLTTSQLLCPRLLRGWDVVDLRSVAGVGMRSIDPPPIRGRKVQPWRGWRAAVWLTGEHRVPIPLVVPSAQLPRLPSAPDPEDLLVLAPALAESWPGQVLRQIAEQVAAASAPGPSEYDQHRYEASAHVERFEKAYWSPDGQMGLLR